MINSGMVPVPSVGRRFSARRVPGLGDVDPSGSVRLDALARLLQDVATADAEDAGVAPGWVVRRTVINVERWPRLGERIELTTFCSGLGARWAERRTHLKGEGGSVADAAALWVHVDEHGRPARLDAPFLALYSPSAAGRTVRAKLTHGPASASASARPWAIRYTDLDVVGHVNNAASLEAIVDELSLRASGPVRHASIEYPGAIDAGEEVTLRSAASDRRFDVWLTVGDEVRVSAVVVTS